jgi:hypothetical protein
VILRREFQGFPIVKTVGTALAILFVSDGGAENLEDCLASILLVTEAQEIHSPVRRKIEKLRR